jgi:hypothetical protein
MSMMAEAKSPEYVTNWLVNIGRQVGLAEHEVATALERVTGQACAEFVPGTIHLDRDRVTAIVGGLTPDQAKQVVAEAKALATSRYPHGRCHSCGLALDARGACRECI